MVKKKFPEIEILVWDLDGTLYQNIPNLLSLMRKAFIKILEEHRKIEDKEAEKLLNDTVKIYKSATKSLMVLGCGQRKQISQRIEEIVNKPAFLKIDRKLQTLFQELSIFRHILLSNTTHKTIVSELEALGLHHNLFEMIVGVDDTGITKPDLMFFQPVLNYTNLPAEKHLMIGDRVEVDLLPAKKLGMKTCLVWDSSTQEGACPEQSEGIDFLLPTVYEVSNILIEK